jgi:ribosomal protein L23
MPARPSAVHFPEMALTLVRRVTAKLPYNHFLFRTEPKWTKTEIKEYLQKIYDVRVARVATYISPGAPKGRPSVSAPPPRTAHRSRTTRSLPVANNHRRQDPPFARQTQSPLPPHRL